MTDSLWCGKREVMPNTNRTICDVKPENDELLSHFKSCGLLEGNDLETTNKVDKLSPVKEKKPIHPAILAALITGIFAVIAAMIISGGNVYSAYIQSKQIEDQIITPDLIQNKAKSINNRIKVTPPRLISPPTKVKSITLADTRDAIRSNSTTLIDVLRDIDVGKLKVTNKQLQNLKDTRLQVLLTWKSAPEDWSVNIVSPTGIDYTMNQKIVGTTLKTMEYSSYYYVSGAIEETTGNLSPIIAQWSGDITVDYDDRANVNCNCNDLSPCNLPKTNISKFADNVAVLEKGNINAFYYLSENNAIAIINAISKEKEQSKSSHISYIKSNLIDLFLLVLLLLLLVRVYPINNKKSYYLSA